VLGLARLLIGPGVHPDGRPPHVNTSHVSYAEQMSSNTRGNFLALPQELRDLVYAECDFLDLKRLACTHLLIKHEAERHYKAFRSVEEKDWLARKACGDVHLHPIFQLPLSIRLSAETASVCHANGTLTYIQDLDVLHEHATSPPLRRLHVFDARHARGQLHGTPMPGKKRDSCRTLNTRSHWRYITVAEVLQRCVWTDCLHFQVSSAETCSTRYSLTVNGRPTPRNLTGFHSHFGASDRGWALQATR